MSEVSMKTVVALVSFSDGDLSMYKGEMREITEAKATSLISSGYVEEYVPAVPDVGTNDKDKYLHTNAETGAKEWNAVEKSEAFFVNITDMNGTVSCDKTYAEIDDAYTSGKSILVCSNKASGYSGLLKITTANPKFFEIVLLSPSASGLYCNIYRKKEDDSFERSSTKTASWNS